MERATGVLPAEGEGAGRSLIGNQIGNTQMPDFDAVILQFGYHFKL